MLSFQNIPCTIFHYRRRKTLEEAHVFCCRLIWLRPLPLPADEGSLLLTEERAGEGRIVASKGINCGRGLDFFCRLFRVLSLLHSAEAGKLYL